MNKPTQRPIRWPDMIHKTFLQLRERNPYRSNKWLRHEARETVAAARGPLTRKQRKQEAR